MCHSPTESYLNFTLRVEGVHLPTTGCFLLDAVGADGLWIEPLDLVVLLLPAEHPVTGVPPRPHRQGGVEEKLGLPVRLASPEAGRARVSGLGSDRHEQAPPTGFQHLPSVLCAGKGSYSSWCFK